MASWLRNRRIWYAGAALVVAAAAGVSAGVALSGSGGPATVSLSAAPLGVNVAPWDSVYTGQGAPGIIQPRLRTAWVRQLRYGGGSYADFYDWQTNTNIGNCLPGNATASFTSGCSSGDPLPFAAFSRQARTLGAESLVTVNYGSGTPALASAWVAAAKRTPAEGVALWEVGNESYGCWEVNNPLTGPPAKVSGYQPASGNNGAGANCPQTTQGGAAGTQTMANSYAAHSLPFLKAMKAADPAAQIGVPWAFGQSVAGAGVPDNAAWNNTVLGADGSYASFVDAHFYPFNFSGAAGGGNPTDEQVLRSLLTIPALARSVKSGLSAHGLSTYLVGETGVSSSPTTTACTPVGAVFAAGDVLSWLAAGARSVDWWDLNNYGNTGTACTSPDYGLFTSSMSSPAPETAYYGYLLASALARPGARLGTLDTSDPADVLAFQSALPDGTHAVAFVNLAAGTAHTVTFTAPGGLSGNLRASVYSAGAQNPTNSEIVTGTTSADAAAGGLRLPPESVTVLSTR